MIKKNFGLFKIQKDSKGENMWYTCKLLVIYIIILKYILELQ